MSESSTPSVRKAIPVKGWLGPSAMILVSMAVIAITGLTVWPKLKEACEKGPEVRVKLVDQKNLRKHSPVQLNSNGMHLGRIVGFETGLELKELFAVVELENSPSIIEKVCKQSTAWHVLELDLSEHYAKITGEERVFGPALRVLLRNPDSPFCEDFEASGDPPPSSAVDVNREPISLVFRRDMKAISNRAWVIDRHTGLAIGQLYSVRPITKALVEEEDSVLSQLDGVIGNGTETLVQVYLFHSAKDDDYTWNSTSWSLDFAELSGRGLEGSPKSWLIGPNVVVHRDVSKIPGTREDKHRVFWGESSSPPKFVSRWGEKELYLVSQKRLEDDTEVILANGRFAGRTLPSVMAEDGNSFFTAVRIAQDSQSFVRRNTRVAKEPKFLVKFFEKDQAPTGIFDFGAWKNFKPETLLPQTPQAFTRPRIILFTPPESGEPYPFELSAEEKQRPDVVFTLYDEPEWEWTRWKPSITPASDQDLPPLPKPVVVKTDWQERATFGNGKKHHSEGPVLLLDNGVLGLKRILSPIPLDMEPAPGSWNLLGRNGMGSLEAQVVSSDVSFAPISFSTEKAESIWNREMLGRMETAQHLWIPTDDKNPKVLDARRLSRTEDGWRVESFGGTFLVKWNGLPVVVKEQGSPLYGKVVGFLRLDAENEERPVGIVEIPDAWLGTSKQAEE